MFPYILSLLFYRLSNGCLLLAVSWLLLNQSNSGEKNLIWVVVSSFLPALIVAPLTNSVFKYLSSIKATLLGILIIISIVLMMIFSISNPIIIILLNFLLWCVFFFLEGTWEAWFAEIISNIKNQDKIKKLNSFSMTVSQVSLMLGPLLVGPSTRIFDNKGPFYIAILLYILSIVGITYYNFSKHSIVTKEFVKSVIKQENLLDIFKKLPSLFLFTALIFVWPVLGMLNMMLPIIGKTRLDNVVDKVAILDAMLSFGMAAAGIFLAMNFSKKIFSAKGIFVFSVIGVVSILPLCLILKNFNIMTIFIFAFGFSFGGLRILIRNSFFEFLKPTEIGRLVATANAIGFPVVTFFAFMYGFFPESGEISPLTTYILFFVFLMIGSLSLNKVKVINKRVDVN